MRVQGARAWVRVGLTFAAAAVMVAQIGGCGQTVAGKPTAEGGIDTTDAGGLEVTDGPTGPRQGVEDAKLEVENTDGGEMDRLAINAVADLYDYWDAELPANFDGKKFDHIERLVSYDSEGTAMTLCGASTEKFQNAFYCGGGGEDLIAWDRGVLLPMLAKKFDPISVVGVLAHEMGHAVQFRLSESNMNQSVPTIVREQQADCYMGNFMRYVAEGKAEHFDLNTGQGLNQILATLFFIRDPAGYDHMTEGAHGLAFDRVYAFQEGFTTKDPNRCDDMDVDEINERIAEKERSEKDEESGGEAALNTKTLGLLQDSLDEAFKDNGAEQPKITENGSKCSGTEATSPATYCADDNIVGIDLDKLKQIAEPPSEGSQPNKDGAGIGDFAAFAEIASRYTLAIQKQIGADLEGDSAGLRTACLTGAWTATTVDEDPDKRDDKLHLAVGDLDEAVAELLQDNSLIAADVNGKQVQSGFARVEAFRRGYIDGSGPCTEEFA